MQHIHGLEFLEIIYKHVGTHEPLSVILAPHCLAPTSVGEREMEAVLIEVVPIFSRDDVPERIGEIMCHHLRFASRSRSEIHKRDVVVGIDKLGLYKFRSLFTATVEVVPTFGNLRAD